MLQNKKIHDARAALLSNIRVRRFIFQSDAVNKHPKYTGMAALKTECSGVTDFFLITQQPHPSYSVHLHRLLNKGT